MIPILFDADDFQRRLDELFLRLKAWDSFEAIPEPVRNILDDCLSGRGFEFAYVRGRATSSTGDGLLKIQVVGKLDEALATLRAMQGDVCVAHV
jgi:hypothetical protein